MSSLKIENQQKREFLAFVSKMLGVSASATLLTSAGIRHALAFSGLSESDQFLQEGELNTLIAFEDTILPQTSTPSASQVGCHEFVQSQILKVHGREKLEECKFFLEGIEKQSVAIYKTSFESLKQEQQIKLLSKVENDENDDLHKALLFHKSLIVFGYFTSKIGASQVLRYQAVPGGFKGSVKIDANTPGWGSLEYY